MARQNSSHTDIINRPLTYRWFMVLTGTPIPAPERERERKGEREICTEHEITRVSYWAHGWREGGGEREKKREKSATVDISSYGCRVVGPGISRLCQTKCFLSSLSLDLSIPIALINQLHVPTSPPPSRLKCS